MSLISSVTGAAASLAAGLDPVTTTARRAPGQPASGPGGLASPGAPDLLTAMLGPGVSASKGGSGKAGSASASAARTGKAGSGSGSGSAKASAAKSGYAKAPAGDAFAFLKDPALSVEEKLFRFMCAVAKRNDDELVRKMEEMKGGQAPAAGGKAGGTSGGAGAAKKPAALNVWGALKALVPPLGMAAQLVGDARLKSLITQVSGPVLAAAATALGMPALAPLALKAGPGLASAAMEGKLGGGAAAAAVGGAAGGTGGGASSGGTGQAAGAAGSGQSEQLQMMELQRLVDKQKEMFAMISSVLRSQHDTRMAIIGNVR
jgi:hypothetical protein